MIQYYKMKWIKWPLIRAHLCTLAVSFGFSSTWRAPREAFRFGGLQFTLATSAAALLVLPLALLQLALGQLSQQDSVGIWRAVPFFKGVGYLRLLVSALCCVCSAVYVALSVAYFLYTLSNSIPFRACSDPRLNEDGFEDIINMTNCLNATFLAPVRQKPEYFIAMSLIICFIWIALPFLLYSPVKLMKRVFYILGPTLVVVGVVVVSGTGSWGRLTWFHEARHWRHFLEPRVWISALTQALLATHTAGGYLVSAGDAVYSVTNVQWTAIAFVATNIVAGWLGPLFWFALGTAEPDTGAAAVLEQAYQAAYERDLSITWPLLVFAALFLSGVITMLTFLYPIYDRVRRSGGARWRVACAGGSAIGAAGTLVALAGRWDALAVIEDTAVPLLVCCATVLEVLAFVFIYGWKALMEDVEFLTGRALSKFWMLGWCTVPGVITPLLLWWLVVVLSDGGWAEPPWAASGAAATGAVAMLVVLTLAAVTVARQVQYDVIGKLKSSFRPSRHWGPRDPVAHYYWLARREEPAAAAAGESGVRVPRFRRRQPGQLSGAHCFLDVPDAAPAGTDVNSNEVKRRSNSDDWIYTIYRRKYLETAFCHYLAKGRKFRSLSVDWAQMPRRQHRDSMDLKILSSSVYITPAESIEIVKEVNSK